MMCNNESLDLKHNQKLFSPCGFQMFGEQNK